MSTATPTRWPNPTSARRLSSARPPRANSSPNSRRSRASLGLVVSVGREEIIDDPGAVLVVDDTQTNHPCEQQRPHELAYGKLEVELVELSVGVGTLQDGFKRLAVVLDDACLQCAFASLPVVGVVGTVVSGPQGYPGQGRRMQRRLFVQRRLAAHQFDKPVTQRSCRRRRHDRRE